MSDRSLIIKDRLFACIHKGELNNDDLVQIFEHVAIILNIKTLSQYAKDENISYQGAIKRKLKIYKFNGLKLVTDNY